jgi:hypothetical protein
MIGDWLRIKKGSGICSIARAGEYSTRTSKKAIEVQYLNLFNDSILSLKVRLT